MPPCDGDDGAVDRRQPGGLGDRGQQVDAADPARAAGRPPGARARRRRARRTPPPAPSGSGRPVSHAAAVLDVPRRDPHLPTLPARAPARPSSWPCSCCSSPAGTTTTAASPVGGHPTSAACLEAATALGRPRAADEPPRAAGQRRPRRRHGEDRRRSSDDLLAAALRDLDEAATDILDAARDGEQAPRHPRRDAGAAAAAYEAIDAAAQGMETAECGRTVVGGGRSLAIPA